MPFNHISDIQHLDEPQPPIGHPMLTATSPWPSEIHDGYSADFSEWLENKMVALRATGEPIPYFPTAPVAYWIQMVPAMGCNVDTYKSELAETHYEFYLLLEEFEVRYMKKYEATWNDLYLLLVEYQTLCHHLMRTIYNQPKG